MIRCFLAFKGLERDFAFHIHRFARHIRLNIALVSLQCVRILRFEISPFSIAVGGTYCVGASNCPLLRKLGLFAQIQLLLHSQATGFHLQLKCCNIIVAPFLFFFN